MSKNESVLNYLKEVTPARIGVGRAGTRPLTTTLLQFRADHATAQDAVLSEILLDKFTGLGMVAVQSHVPNKQMYLTRPDLGRKLPMEQTEYLKKHCIHNPQVQIVVADGLSAKAIEANIEDILLAFTQGLKIAGISTGTPVFVRYGRVAVGDPVALALNAELVIIFIGERPGLGTAESMSAYITYKPGLQTMDSQRKVVSNIHKGGLPPVEAGAHLSVLVKHILEAKSSGLDFQT